MYKYIIILLVFLFIYQSSTKVKETFDQVIIKTYKKRHPWDVGYVVNSNYDVAIESNNKKSISNLNMNLSKYNKPNKISKDNIIAYYLIAFHNNKLNFYLYKDPNLESNLSSIKKILNKVSKNIISEFPTNYKTSNVMEYQLCCPILKLNKNRLKLVTLNSDNIYYINDDIIKSITYGLIDSIINNNKISLEDYGFIKL